MGRIMFDRRRQGPPTFPKCQKVGDPFRSRSPRCGTNEWNFQTAKPQAVFRSLVRAPEFELRNQRRVFSLEAGETFLRQAVGLEAANQKR